MKKIFLDTNVFLRFFVADAKKQHEECVFLMSQVQLGKFYPYTSGFVIAELNYVLTKIYGYKKPEVLGAITRLLEIRNLTLVERVDTRKALGLYKKHNIKFGDCFIAAQVPKNVKLVTYDSDFSKIKSLVTVTPADLI